MNRQSPSAAPMQLLWLSAVTWRFPLIGRTRMLTEALRAGGRSVPFVQVPYLRSGVERLVHALTPRTLPDVIFPWPAYPVSWWQRLPEARLRTAMRRRASELRAQLDQRIDVSRTVALVVSPVWNGWLDSLPFKSVVYDCIDHVDVHAPRPELRPMFRRWEEELLGRSSAVVVSASSLKTSLLARSPSTSMKVIRNGVDSESFRRLAETATRPADLPPSGRRPLVGFVGALYEWLDVELIGRVAEALPGIDFVFVGPTDGQTPLPDLPNVRSVGLRPYEEVPAYVAAFDVCWLPFKQGDIAAMANPVKLYEYLALGKPVVATPIADEESFGDHVRFGSSATEVTELLQHALHDSGDHAARMTFADQNSWHERARSLSEFVEATCC